MGTVPSMATKVQITFDAHDGPALVAGSTDPELV